METKAERQGESFRAQVLRQVERRFRYRLPGTSSLFTPSQRLPLLRRLCLIFGLQIKAKAKAAEEAFVEADIASFRPVVSSARINPTMSDLLYAQARAAIDQKDVKGAIQFLYEAIVQSETTDGVGSSELGQIYTTIYQLLDDKEHALTAIDCCSKAIIAFERGVAGDGGSAVVHAYVCSPFDPSFVQSLTQIHSIECIGTDDCLPCRWGQGDGQDKFVRAGSPVHETKSRFDDGHCGRGPSGIATH